ncbi:MAG: carbohydrate ABC transporter permease [Sphaerochaeta sp.]|nr:carbohydrate ABC transporter permease [Sphaerochaeta sp.]
MQKSLSKKRQLEYNLLLIAGITLAALWLLPLVGVLMASLRPYSEIIDGWWRFDEFNISLKNYKFVLFETTIPMVRPLFNSLFSSFLGALIPAMFGTMAAYAFTRHKLPGKMVVTIVILCLMAIPGQMLAIPVFKRINSLGLLDTYTGVILMNTVTSLPWIMFFMMNVIKSQSISIEEAARIDGASEYGVFLHVVLPQSVPALSSILILQFVWSWNSFFWPLIIIFDMNKLMATQVIPMLRGQFYTNWGALSAAALLVMGIPILVFLSFQRTFIQGSVGFADEK